MKSVDNKDSENGECKNLLLLIIVHLNDSLVTLCFDYQQLKAEAMI